MKKGMIVFLVMLLVLLPCVYSSVVITSAFRSEYNIGDEITVEGYVLAEDDIDEEFSITLECNDNTDENSVQLMLEAGQKVTFTSLDLNYFVLDEEDNCKVVVKYGDSREVSSRFAVTDRLEALFNLNKQEFQLGDSFVLKGTVFRIDGSNVEGLAKVYLRSPEDSSLLLDDVDIFDGSFTLTKKLTELDGDRYYVEVVVEDDNGNSQEFERIETIDIYNQLELDVDSDKNEYDPEDLVTILGKVITETDGLDEATVTVLFDNDKYTTTLDNDLISYQFKIPEDLKSGEYGVFVSVTDPIGNYGYEDLIIYINQVANEVEGVLDAIEINPGETLSANVVIYDQAGDLMDGKVYVEIVDPDNELVYSGEITTKQEVEVDFSKYSQPGTYKFITSLNDIEDEASFIVKELESASFSYASEKVYIKNEGNVEYDRTVEIVLIDEGESESEDDDIQYIVKKEIVMQPDSVTEIDLTTEVPPGDYSIYLGDSSTEYITDSYPATGYVVSAGGEQPGVTYTDQFEDVNLESDNRPITKKVEQKMSDITGATTVDTSKTNKSPYILFALFILVVSGMLGLYVYDNREAIMEWWEDMNMPEDDKKRIFKDIKYKKPFQLAKKTGEAETINVDKLGLDKPKFNSSQIKKSESPSMPEANPVKNDKDDFMDFMSR